MTSPIKPVATGIAAPIDVTSDATTTVGAAGSSSAVASAQGVSSPAVSELAAQLGAGAISREAFVDGLVRAELAKPTSKGLSEAGRREVEAALRDALAGDPAIARLIADLERGR